MSSIDLILWGPDRATFRTFAVANGMINEVPSEDEQGNPITVDVPRRGFAYSWWNGSGKLMTERRTLRATQAVDQSNATEFAFNIGAATPDWLDNTVVAQDPATLETVGTYDRKQGNFAVFTSTGTSPTVGATLDVYSGPLFLDGQVALLRIYDEFFDEDKLDAPLVDSGEVDEEGNPILVKAEQWARSKVARYIKNNGTPGTVAGGSIPYYEVDSVRIFRPQDVETWLTTNGLPTHSWIGGNRY